MLFSSLSCCSRECFQEFDWRHVLAVTGKPYTPRPVDPAPSPPVTPGQDKKAEGWHLVLGSVHPHYFVGSNFGEVASLCGRWRHKGPPTAGSP